MAADQLGGNRAAAVIGNVGEFRSGLLLDRRGDDLVFLLGSGAAHLHLAVGFLDGIDIGDGTLVVGLGVGPQHEFVERHHRDRRVVLPAERRAGRQRCREQVGQGDDELVRIVLGILHIKKAFGAGPALLADHDHRGRHQIVLLDDALDQLRHLTGAATNTCRDNELNGAGRLPFGLCGVEGQALLRMLLRSSLQECAIDLIRFLPRSSCYWP